MTNDGLTDIEKAWLVGIDALLMHGSPQGHAVTAGRIVDLWGAGGVEFQGELARRADVWRKRHMQVLQMAGDGSGPCNRLMQLMGNPTTVDLKPSKPPAPRRPRPKRGPVVRPSRAGNYPAPKMTDKEVERFLDLIDSEGISSVFDPGVSVMPDDVLFRPPLITIDGAGVFYDQIAPAYDRGEIERPWSPHEMEPRIALAFDYALLIIARERKWTWVISDRYLRRLPWGHPCKMTPEGRPGWSLLTDMLEHAGYIERRKGQTWRLAEIGRMAAKQIRVCWQARSSGLCRGTELYPQLSDRWRNQHTRPYINDRGLLAVVLAVLYRLADDEVDCLTDDWKWNDEPLAWFNPLTKAVGQLNIEPDSRKEVMQ